FHFRASTPFSVALVYTKCVRVMCRYSNRRQSYAILAAISRTGEGEPRGQVVGTSIDLSPPQSPSPMSVFRTLAHHAVARRLSTATLLVVSIAVRALAQSGDGSARANAYGVGESLVYDVKFGFLNVGTARMDVLGIETIRGRRAWHTKLEITGGIPGYRVHEVLESWIDVETQNSLRSVKESVEGSRERRYVYEIMPERGVFRENDKPEQPTVEHPLDDGAFLYFVRNQPLVVGNTYDFPRYFIPDRNPVTVIAQRTEKVDVPAGSFATVVVRPVIKARGVFSKNGRAELWLTNDARRLMVRMETHLAFGTISLRLREFTQGLPQP
ncbi:MAG: DUF3108 domain-containing protein, partial [Gemmatimonadaceae bacterium]